MGKRVDNGIDDRRRRADGAGLAATFDAERIVRARGHFGGDFERRQIVGARHRVIHVGAGDQLAGLAVVDAAFEQRLTDPLRKPAVHLAFDDHGIDDIAEVVHRGKTCDRRRTRFGVDLDFADMAAGRIGKVGRIVERGFIEPGLQFIERVIVGHVSGQRDLRERHLFVGTGDRELAVLEFDVGVRGFHEVRCDFLALGDDLVERLHYGRTADRDRARAVSAHAEGYAPGVAVHDVDVADRDTKTVRNHLRERRFVPLAVAVRTGKYRHLAGRMHAYLAGLEEPRARAERAGDVRRRKPARFDVSRVADAAQFAAARGVGFARRETGDIRELDGSGKRCFVIAGVVTQCHRRLIRKRCDEVAPPEIGVGDFHFARRGRDEPLDDESRLGAPGPAIGVDRCRVREDGRDFAVNRGRRVLSGEQRRVQDGRNARRERREVGAKVGSRVHAHRQKFAVLIEGQLGGRQVIAAVRVGQEGFRALGGPLDRAVDALAGPRHHRFFGIQKNLGTKAAADVRSDDAYFVFRQPEHERGHQETLHVRILARDIQRVTIIPARVAGDGGARLDRIWNEPALA